MWGKAIALMGTKVRVQERKEDEEMEIMSIDHSGFLLKRGSRKWVCGFIKLFCF